MTKLLLLTCSPTTTRYKHIKWLSGTLEELSYRVADNTHGTESLTYCDVWFSVKGILKGLLNAVLATIYIPIVDSILIYLLEKIYST